MDGHADRCATSIFDRVIDQIGDRPAQRERPGQYRGPPFTGVGHRAAGVGSILADPFDRGIGEYPRLPPRIGGSSRQLLARAGLDHCCALLGDHDRRGVGVCRADRRHHRGVDDPQRLEPVDPELVVDDRHAVIAHHARAARVVDGRTVRARVIEQLVVALHARSRQVLADDVFGERRRGEQTPQELQSADNRALIGVFGEVARVDRRLVVRVLCVHQDIAARQRRICHGPPVMPGRSSSLRMRPGL